MKVIVFGATGKSGGLVVEKAVAAGHEVTAFVHGESEPATTGVRIISGDASDAGVVRRAVAGQDAVIDTIGGTTPWTDSGLEASTAAAVVAGMRAEGVRRLIVISAMGVEESADQAGFIYGKLLLPTMMRGVVKDKTHMEEEVDNSGLDFVIVRPAQLSDDPADGKLRVIPAPTKAHHTRRGDLAQFLVDQLTSDIHLGQAIVVAND